MTSMIHSDSELNGANQANLEREKSTFGLKANKKKKKSQKEFLNVSKVKKGIALIL
jgi:hypothetical protein